jgi:hypothetical protein
MASGARSPSRRLAAAALISHAPPRWRSAGCRHRHCRLFLLAACLETLGILHDDGAQRRMVAGSVGLATMQSTAAPLGRLVAWKAWAIQPSLKVWLAADAVSQISIERKCERLG